MFHVAYLSRYTYIYFVSLYLWYCHRKTIRCLVLSFGFGTNVDETKHDPLHPLLTYTHVQLINPLLIGHGLKISSAQSGI